MNIIFWIAFSLLALIFVFSCLGISRAIQARYLCERVVCAGSVDNSYPDKVKVRKPKFPINIDDKELDRFVVKGNSIQFTNINSDDIIYVRSADIEAIKNQLPVITILRFTPDKPRKAEYIIRWTWKVINSDITEADIQDVLVNILKSREFLDLKNEIGERCPSDKELMQLVYKSFLNYKEYNQNVVDEVLLSTTFNTENDRLEFSIYPSDAIEGVVVYVSHLQK